MVSQQLLLSTPDWSREQIHKWWDPGRQLLKAIRNYQYWQERGGVLGHYFTKHYAIQHRFWSVVTGADIALNCHIQGGLLIPHPNGIVIHPKAVIGPNCLILQQVTIVSGVIIGGYVDIGSGAKIIRPVSIGDAAQIGANAVVLHNVPAHTTAVGIPAKVLSNSVAVDDTAEHAEALVEAA